MTDHQNSSAESCDLKPCPFCGGKPYDDEGWVFCNPCDIGFGREAWNRRTPDDAQGAVVSDPGPLEATKKLLINASVGSCTCNTKSPELMWHAPNCRYVTIMMALENVEIASQPSPAATVEISQASYCALCDLEHELHEDAQGFHHVIKGERAACVGGSPARSSAGNGDDLLPCPFCGGEADFYENWVDHERKWSVSCGDCNANLDVCADTKTEAAAPWNDRLRAVPQEAQVSSADRATAWLIEWQKDDNNPARWWNPAHGWMRDANKALWFARKTDADCYLSTMKGFGVHLRATEHIFIGDKPQEAAHSDVEARIAVLSDALKSISKNTCCGNCQEAARVARSALGAYVGLARTAEGGKQ